MYNQLTKILSWYSQLNLFIRLYNWKSVGHKVLEDEQVANVCKKMANTAHKDTWQNNKY